MNHFDLGIISPPFHIYEEIYDIMLEYSEEIINLAPCIYDDSKDWKFLHANYLSWEIVNWNDYTDKKMSLFPLLLSHCAKRFKPNQIKFSNNPLWLISYKLYKKHFSEI